ncbi:DUF1059 domain-containing protein [Haloarchaeobius sp. TZWWS8]|uniref:DUF1059 domain-containing protein n=1 Tax=Haloarchaeobius sp. TZWWS8 TaxID=3446121 RepID=UPI003EB91563
MVKEFECTMEDCHFVIHSDSDDEIVSMVRKHAQDVHGMSMNAGQIKGGIKTLQA